MMMMIIMTHMMRHVHMTVPKKTKTYFTEFSPKPDAQPPRDSP